MSNEAAATEEVPDLVPIALIAVETNTSADWVANRFSNAVTLDDVGLRAVPAAVARAFFTERADQKARQLEQARRRTEEAARRQRPVPVGAPAVEGLTPHEAMVLNDPSFSTPADDYGLRRGNPQRELLDDALAAGLRDLAEKRAKNRARK